MSNHTTMASTDSTSSHPHPHSQAHPHPPSISRPTSHQQSISRPISISRQLTAHSTSRTPTSRPHSSATQTSRYASKPTSRQSTRNRSGDHESSEKESKEDRETYMDEFELPDDIERSETEGDETEEEEEEDEEDDNDDDMNISIDHDDSYEMDEKKSTSSFPSTRSTLSQQPQSHHSQSRPHPPHTSSISASSVSARLYTLPSSRKKGSSDLLSESSHYNLGRIGGLPILQWSKAKLPIGIVLSQRSYDTQLQHRLNRTQRLATLKCQDVERLVRESEMELKAQRHKAAQQALDEARRIERELQTRRRTELIAQARAYELKLMLRKSEAYTMRQQASQTMRQVTDDMKNQRMEQRHQVRTQRSEKRQEQVKRTELERRLKEMKEKELTEKYAKERSDERKKQREMKKKFDKGSSNDDSLSDLDSDSCVVEVHRGYHGSPPRSPGRRLHTNPITDTSYSTQSNGPPLFHPQTPLHVSRSIPIECHSPTLAQRRAKCATIVWSPSESQQSSSSNIIAVIVPKRDLKATEERRKKAEVELSEMKKRLEIERAKMEQFQKKRNQTFQTKANEKKIEHERKISSISLNNASNESNSNR